MSLSLSSPCTFRIHSKKFVSICNRNAPPLKLVSRITIKAIGFNQHIAPKQNIHFATQSTVVARAQSNGISIPVEPKGNYRYLLSQNVVVCWSLIFNG